MDCTLRSAVRESCQGSKDRRGKVQEEEHEHVGCTCSGSGDHRAPVGVAPFVEMREDRKARHGVECVEERAVCEHALHVSGVELTLDPGVRRRLGLHPSPEISDNQ